MQNSLGIYKRILLLIVGSIFGLWLYVIVASFLGVIKELFWWGGEGWFLPVFGTLVMAVGAVPLCYIAKLIFNRSVTLISARSLLSVGFIHGLVFLLALQLASFLIGIMVGLVASQFNAVIEITIAIIKAGSAFFVSGTLAAYIVTWFVNRQSASGKRM